MDREILIDVAKWALEQAARIINRTNLLFNAESLITEIIHLLVEGKFSESFHLKLQERKAQQESAVKELIKRWGHTHVEG